MDATRAPFARNPADPLALAERRIAWLESRQRVLAQNIANADTPGYQPRDLRAFSQVLAGAAGPGLARTDARHLGPTRGEADSRRDRMAAERTPDGNAVSLDQQALRVAETDSAHALALGLYRRYHALMRTALGRSQ